MLCVDYKIRNTKVDGIFSQYIYIYIYIYNVYYISIILKLANG